MDQAAERLAMLRRLAGWGVTLDEMVAAADVGRLPIAGAARLINGGEERLTLAEVVERSGVDHQAARAVWLADGFPDPGDERLFSERDVTVFPLLTAGINLFGEAMFLQVARVLGSSLARVAEAEVAAFALTVGTDLARKGATEAEIIASLDSVAALIEPLTAVIDVLHRHHLAAAVQRLAYTTESLAQGPAAVTLAVGFADLTGYTALSQRLPLGELADALADFDAVASDVVAGLGGRVVKLIGDEVMFATHSVDDALAVTTRLMRAVEDHPVLPGLRAGIAHGVVITREGDYFGTVVNLAARAASAASVGQVLVDAATQQSATSAWQFRTAGAVELKGFDSPVELFEVLAAPGGKVDMGARREG